MVDRYRSQKETMNATNLLKLIASSFVDGSRLVVLSVERGGISVVVSNGGYAAFKAVLTKGGKVKHWSAFKRTSNDA